MIEVFKTNVQTQKQANEILRLLSTKYPAAKVNFDLSDCDKILRIVESKIFVDEIIKQLKQTGFKCEVLQ